MAPHSSTLAWRIPGTGEPHGLPSMGSHRVGHDWSDLAAAAAAELVILSKHLILSCPLLLPSVFPSIRVFFNELSLHIRWPKCWSFSFSFSPSNEYSGLISFKIDWFELLAVQGTLKSLLQHHSSKASILRHSTFFIAQLSYPNMTIGKTIALTRWTFVSKVVPWLCNMLSMFVIAFLPRSKCLLSSWQQSPSAVNLEPKKIKSVTVSTFPPSLCHEVKRLDAMILVFFFECWVSSQHFSLYPFPHQESL